MKVPWPGDCCILCLEPFAANGPHAVSEEHVIPKSVLGILPCDFLCCDCNSKSGADLDHALKRDPAIRLAAAKALADDGTLAREMEHRQIWQPASARFVRKCAKARSAAVGLNFKMGRASRRRIKRSTRSEACSPRTDTTNPT